MNTDATHAEFPADLKAKVKARLAQPRNLGKLIWVERNETGDWLVHASTGPEADQRMQAAHNAGRIYATAAEVLDAPA